MENIKSKLEEAKDQLIEITESEFNKLMKKNSPAKNVDWMREDPQIYGYSTTNVDWLGVSYEFPLMRTGKPLFYFKHWVVRSYGYNCREGSFNKEDLVNRIKKSQSKEFRDPYNISITEEWLHCPWWQLEEMLEEFNDLIPDKFIIKKTKRLKTKPFTHFREPDAVLFGEQ